MDDPRFWQAALALAAPLCFWFGFRNLRLARLIDDTPVSRIRSAAQGYVELSGIARMAEGPPTIAPLSQLPCAWWMYRIEEHKGSGRDARWETINRAVSVAPFQLVDETGACLVGPTGADVRPGHRDCWRGSLPWPTAPGGGRRDFGLGVGDYRYTEHRLNEGEQTSVIGEFRTLGGVNNADTTVEVMRLLAEWKKDQGALLERFDTNQDGVLSQAEWERARAAARALIEQRSPRTAAPTASIVVKPVDGRPFLIAASNLGSVARRSRIAAAVLLLAFVAAVAALAILQLGPG
jgi:E3 Ubiquitin ligase